ncbi:hypothetical protein [Rummeliibacillus pycnus]|uniref:hypothetical protein n=1 Tax=Rummeliibacillus pycnus TaxID=101070 RepID=UPI0037CA5C5B
MGEFNNQKKEEEEKMNKKIYAIIIGSSLAFSLTGCGTSQDHNQSQSNTLTQSNTTSKSTKDDSMKGMEMENNQALAKAFKDELDGFTTIEQDIKKGDYKSANTIAGKLHDEFHAAILPPLKAKKGEVYAEEIHGKYDALQDAITSKDNTNITKLIKVNRDNLKKVAEILGVSIK